MKVLVNPFTGELTVTATTGGGGGTTPGGSTGNIQYNNAGAFGGFGSWDGTNLGVTGGANFSADVTANHFLPTANFSSSVGTFSQPFLTFYGGGISLLSNGQVINMFAPSLSGSYNFELPLDNGTNGQLLQTDGIGNWHWWTPVITTNLTGAATAGTSQGTEYRYFCTGTFTLTMPTALGNTGKYIINNQFTGTITIATSSGQTIAGASTKVISTRYTTVTLISDGANWAVV